MLNVSEDWDFPSEQANASIPLLRDLVARQQSSSLLTETASRTESPASVNSELELEEICLEVFRKVHIQADKEVSTTEKSAEKTSSKGEFSINAEKSDPHIEGFELSDYHRDREEDTSPQVQSKDGKRPSRSLLPPKYDTGPSYWAEYYRMQHNSSKGLGILREPA